MAAHDGESSPIELRILLRIKGVSFAGIARRPSERTIPLPTMSAELLQRLKLTTGGSVYVFISLRRLAQLRGSLESDGSLPCTMPAIQNMRHRFTAIQRRAAILPLLRKARHPGDGRSDSELATSVFARYRLNDGSLVSPKWDDEHAPELDGKAVKAALTEWKIGTFHDLRRTFCTRAAAVLPMHVLKHYAGHADIATTVAFYLQTDADDAAKLRAAMSAVA